MHSSYPLSYDFLLRLLSLIFSGNSFSSKILSTIDPSLIAQKEVSIIFGCIKSFFINESYVPSSEILDQLLYQRYQSGSITRELYESSLLIKGKAQQQDPVSKEDAQAVLYEAVIDSEVISALDDCFRFYKSKEYAKIFSRMNAAEEKPRILKEKSSGYDFWPSLEGYLDNIQACNSSVERYPIGIDSFDAVIKGGLAKGELGCVLAAMKDGKSMFMAHIAATNLMLGFSVLYVTLELTEMQVFDRVISNITGITSDQIAKGGLSARNEVREKVLSRISRYANSSFVFWPPKSATVKDVALKIEDCKKNWGHYPDIVIVDYADELLASTTSKVDFSSSANYHAMGSVYSDLKALGSKESKNGIGGYDCAVWTASQVQRSSVGSEYLDIKSVAESMLKVAKVDLMVALCRNDIERSSELMRFYVTACRYAKFPQEIGPLIRDYERARLVQFDSTVKRYSERTAKWAKKKLAARIFALEKTKTKKILGGEEVIKKREEETKEGVIGQTTSFWRPLSSHFSTLLGERLL